MLNAKILTKNTRRILISRVKYLHLFKRIVTPFGVLIQLAAKVSENCKIKNLFRSRPHFQEDRV